MAENKKSAIRLVIETMWSTAPILVLSSNRSFDPEIADTGAMPTFDKFEDLDKATAGSLLHTIIGLLFRKDDNWFGVKSVYATRLELRIEVSLATDIEALAGAIFEATSKTYAVTRVDVSGKVIDDESSVRDAVTRPGESEDEVVRDC